MLWRGVNPISALKMSARFSPPLAEEGIHVVAN